MAKNIVSLMSNKGGTGKTTVAVNTAVAAANLAPNSKVIIIDADPSSRTTSFLANPATTPRKDMFDFFEDPDIPPEAVIVRSQIANNLLVAPNIRGLELHPKTSAKKIALKLEMLMEYFSDAALVIFDLPAGKTKEHLIFAWMTDVYLVTQPLTPSLRAAEEVISTLNRETLTRLGKEENVVKGIIANSVVNTDEVAKVEKYLNLPVIASIPYSSKIEIAGDHDTPLVSYAPEDPATTAFYNLARVFLKTGGWDDIHMPGKKELRGRSLSSLSKKILSRFFSR